MKITPEEAQLALNAFNAHYKMGMEGGANYGRHVTIFADKLQTYLNEEQAFINEAIDEARKKRDAPPAEEPPTPEEPPSGSPLKE